MHAEVAGGGIAGLATAIMLTRRGWSARVHERNDAIREIGAGIFLRQNTLRVLDVLGVAEEIKAEGMRLERGQYRDGVTGEFIHDRASGEGTAMWICPRESLLQALLPKAREAGVEVVTNSEVLAANPSGILTTSKGKFSADLIVGADGVFSAVRDSLNLTTSTERLPSVVTRYLVPSSEFAPEPHATMWWSGRRRIGVAPCGKDMSYVYMVCHETDARASALPVDIDAWAESFPMLAEKLPMLHGISGIQNHYRIVACDSWTSGRVAIVGDAAHGLPPLLGQGAGLALSNANALVASLGDDPVRVPVDLKRWEREFRSFADKTQFWSMHLDRVTNKWPKALTPLRRIYLGALDTKWMRNRMAIADRFPIKSLKQMGQQ